MDCKLNIWFWVFNTILKLSFATFVCNKTSSSKNRNNFSLQFHKILHYDIFAVKYVNSFFCDLINEKRFIEIFVDFHTLDKQVRLFDPVLSLTDCSTPIELSRYTITSPQHSKQIISKQITFFSLRFQNPQKKEKKKHISPILFKEASPFHYRLNQIYYPSVLLHRHGTSKCWYPKKEKCISLDVRGFP